MNRQEYLQKVILRRLFFHGRATRPELVALTGGRAATVFAAIDGLKAEGLVVEPDRRGKKTGRRAPELECNRHAGCFIGLHLRKREVVGVVTDCRGDILEQYEERFPSPGRQLDETLDGIGRCITELRKLLGDRAELLRGIGFADPGEVDPRCGISINAPGVAGWENLDTGAWLTQLCGLPSGVWSEQTATTWMEYATRLGQPPKSLFYLGTTERIGGGFINGGKLFVGSNFREMAIGRTLVASGAPEQPSGTLEDFAGEDGILNAVQRALADGNDFGLSEKNFSVRRFVEYSYRDQTARHIAENLAEMIGSALATVVALLDPAAIIIGGDLSALGDLLLGTVHRQIERSCGTAAAAGVRLELSALEDCDTARGAAMMIRDRILGIDDLDVCNGRAAS